MEIKQANLVGLYLYCGGSKLTEAGMHKKFEKYRKEREWFVHSEEIAIFIDKNCIRPNRQIRRLIAPYSHYISHLRWKIKNLEALLREKE